MNTIENTKPGRRLWACLLAGLALALLMQPLRAEVTGQVLEYGYYQAIKAPQRIRNEQLPSGYERAGGEVRLVRQTELIPLAKDRLFGFHFRIQGFSKDQVTAQLKLVVHHPEITRPDGSKSTGYSYPIPLLVRDGRIDDKTGYQLNKDFEMVEGDWRFEYWLGERKLLEKSFKVVRPEKLSATDAPAPAAMTQAVPALAKPGVQSVMPAAAQTAPPAPAQQASQQAKQIPRAKAQGSADAAESPGAPVVSSTVVNSDKLPADFKKQIGAIIKKYQAHNGAKTAAHAGATTTPVAPVPMTVNAGNGPLPALQTDTALQADRSAPAPQDTQDVAQQQ